MRVFMRNFGNTKISVESTEVEKGARPSRALGGQEVMAVASSRQSPWPLWLWRMKLLPSEPLVWTAVWITESQQGRMPMVDSPKEDSTCRTTSITNWSEVIRSQVARKNASLPPTGKEPFLVKPSWWFHTMAGMSRKPDPSTPSPKMGGMMGESHQRRPAGGHSRDPLPPGSARGHRSAQAALAHPTACGAAHATCKGFNAGAGGIFWCRLQGELPAYHWGAGQGGQEAAAGWVWALL